MKTTIKPNIIVQILVSFFLPQSFEERNTFKFIMTVFKELLIRKVLRIVVQQSSLLCCSRFHGDRLIDSATHSHSSSSLIVPPVRTRGTIIATLDRFHIKFLSSSILCQNTSRPRRVCYRAGQRPTRRDCKTAHGPCQRIGSPAALDTASI